MANDKITKIYDISAIGTDDVIADLEKINRQFVDIKRNKLALNGLKAQVEDPAELQRINKELVDLAVREKQLAVELKQKQVLMKEYQLLAAQEREQKKQLATGNQALEGSYNEVNKRYKELLAISKNSTNIYNPEEVRAAQTELKRLKDVLDNFSRGLTKDGTLVGEYTTGILQAFKNSGLDDVINNQLKQAKQNVTDLDREFEKLQQELTQIRVTGEGALEVVERKMVENRREAQQFQQQIDRVEKELKNMNNSGSSITNSIGLGFKNLKRDVAGFMLSYIGFQAAMSQSREVYQTVVSLDSLNSALKMVSKTQEEFELNQKFLKETSDELGLSIIDQTKAFKGFYTSATLAGISADDTRQVFYAASQASAQLKLSQDDTNGVLLAFAQIASKGKVQAEELRGQIGERLPGAFALAAKAMGVTQQELNKMLEDGKVLSNEFLPKFGKELAAQFATGAEKVEGLQASINRYKNDFATLVEQNQEGLTKLIQLFLSAGSALLAFVTMITALPVSVIVAGLSAITLAVTLYRAEQLRATIATSLATKEGLIYRAWTIAQTIATKAQALATRLATYEIVLFNGALKISPLGWILTVVTLLVPAIIGLANAFGKSKEKVDGLSKSMKEINAAIDEGVKAAGAEIKSLEKLYKTATDLTKSMQERKKAAEEMIKIHPVTLANISAETIMNGKAESSYYALRDAIVAAARAKAAQSELEKREGDRLKRDEFINRQVESLESDLKFQTITINGVSTKVISPSNSNDPFESSRAKAYSDLINQRIANDKLDAEEDKYILGIIEKGNNESEKLRQDREKVAKSIGGGVASDGKKKSGREKKIDRIEDLKKEYEAEMKQLETSLEDKKITEEKYYSDVITMVDKYRINRLSAIHNLNKDEMQTAAAFNRELAKEKNDALQKQFDAELKILDDQRTKREIEIKDEMETIDNDRSLDDIQKIERKLATDEKLIQMQIAYNKAVDVLEATFKLKSTDNAEERANALKEVQKQLGEDLENLQDATFQRMLDDQKENLKAIQREITQQAIDILRGDGSSADKDKLLKGLENSGEKKLQDERLSQISIELTAYQQMLESKLLSQKDFNDKVSELEDERLGIIKSQAEKEVEVAKEKAAAKKKIEETFRDAALQIAEKIAQAAIQQMQNNVDAKYEEQMEILEAEKERRSAQAQSTAEQQTIEREFEEKEKEAERKRNMERQNVARKQLAIEFAVASIKAISTSTNIYEGLAKEAVVLAEYLLALQTLNKQKFKYGGEVKAAKGGVISGPSHEHGGVPIEAEGGEIIINKRSATNNRVISVTGNARQIASALNSFGGGVDFAPGAKGYYGSFLQPPVFASYYQPSGNAINMGAQFDRMEGIVISLADTIAKESYKPVTLNPNAVTNYQNKIAKNVNLATV